MTEVSQRLFAQLASQQPTSTTPQAITVKLAIDRGLADLQRAAIHHATYVQKLQAAVLENQLAAPPLIKLDEYKENARQLADALARSAQHLTSQINLHRMHF